MYHYLNTECTLALARQTQATVTVFENPHTNKPESILYYTFGLKEQN